MNNPIVRKQSFIDNLVTEGDCQGLAIHVSDSKIDAISGDLFTCLKAYISKNKNIDFTDMEDKHFNGIIPIYINEKNWSVGKKYLREMPGYIQCRCNTLYINNWKYGCRLGRNHKYYKKHMLTDTKILTYDGEKYEVANDHDIFYTYLEAYRYALSHGIPGGKEVLVETIQHLYLMMPDVIPTPDEFCSDHITRGRVPDIELLQIAYDILGLRATCKYFADYITEEKLIRVYHKININYLCVIDKNYWIDPYVKAHSPAISAYDYNMLVTTVKANYPEALDKLQQYLQSLDIKTEPEIFYPDPKDYKPQIVLPDWIDERFTCSEERKVLIALNCSDTQFKGYSECISLSEDEVNQVLRQKCIDHINKFRQLGINAHDNKRYLGKLLHQLQAGVDLLTYVNALHGNCYLGVNISEFLTTATTTDHLTMLITGKYDIGPLIKHDKPVIITTVMDMEKRKQQHLPYIEDCESVTYANLFIPNRKTLQKLHERFTKQQLLSVMPVAATMINRYCI